MHRFGAISVRQVSALCDESLWSHAMHKRCYGTFLAKTHSPSGQEPDEVAICTCLCHEDQRKTMAAENAAAWENWENNRAPLIDHKIRWFQGKG